MRNVAEEKTIDYIINAGSTPQSSSSHDVMMDEIESNKMATQWKIRHLVTLGSFTRVTIGAQVLCWLGRNEEPDQHMLDYL